jgi:hypothetical protein
MKHRDFREHVFTATGKDTDLHDFTVIDAYDNVLPELERLGALADLLASQDDDECSSETIGGVALLLKDIQRRLTTIMHTAIHQKKRP